MDWRRASWTQGEPTTKERRAALVLVAVEKRGQASGRVRMSVIPDFKAATIVPFLTQNIAPGSTIYTDGLKSFSGLSEAGFKHVVRKQPLRSGQRREVRCPTCRSGDWQPATVADRHLPRSERGPTPGLPQRISLFGATVARHPQPHFRHSLVSEQANQLGTSRFGERGISTPTYCGLLKQPDN